MGCPLHPGLPGSAGGSLHPGAGVCRAAEGRGRASPSCSAQLTGMRGDSLLERLSKRSIGDRGGLYCTSALPELSTFGGGGARPLPGKAGLSSAFYSVGMPRSRLDPCSGPSPPHQGVGSFQHALKALVPGLSGDSGCWWCPSFGVWPPSTDATSQRPGIRVEEGLFVSDSSGACAMPARVTPVLALSVPINVPCICLRQPAHPAPGQMHRLRIDWTMTWKPSDSSK
ncbi:Hypothetical predicted protein [Marmota monax]|uniref:Uncharacterized protein n=1 Tax=Marmota monax TaxID=9995 RepID=A0A5E4BW23_MARMO|nr:Hypothetical predicted protein [Marmota monax]